MALEPEGPNDSDSEDEELDGENDTLLEPPYQALILFREFPSLDTEALQAAINALEPGEDESSVSELSVGILEPSSEAAEFLPSECVGRRIGTGVISWSDLRLAMVCHDWPAPEESLRFASSAGGCLPPVQEAIEGHKAYAVLNCIDVGGELHPIERMLLMIKTAIVLADQGALAYVNEHNATFFPAELLRQLGLAAGESVQDMAEAEGGDEDSGDGGKSLSLWDSLREEGMPPELLVSVIPLEDERGQLWFVTQGHAQCELPELAYQARNISEYEEIDGHFKNVFSYMMERGPGIAPGHTMGYDENAMMRFSGVPQDRPFLESAYGTLLVTLEKS